MAHAPVAARPRVGVVKFASCDGCQLTLLDLEDELLSVVEHFDIVDFPEATSARSAGPYDVLFVEGSVSEPAHLERIVELRRRTRFLVTIGACATAGGIQALRNWGDHDAFRSGVYSNPEWVSSLARSTPIAEHVTVDAELRGCPIDPNQLLELLTALTTGRRVCIKPMSAIWIMKHPTMKKMKNGLPMPELPKVERIIIIVRPIEGTATANVM